MRLATLHTSAGLRVAVRHGEDYIDLFGSDPAFPSSLRQLLLAGPEVLAHAARLHQHSDCVRVPVKQAKLAAPIRDPQKIICVGLNYRDHAAESGSPIPREPIL